MDLHVMRSLESENHIFSVWYVRVYVCVSVCVCVSVISITQKQITAESSNLAFYICLIGGCYWKLFIKVEQKLCVQGRTKEFKYFTAFGQNFVLVNFRIFRLR